MKPETTPQALIIDLDGTLLDTAPDLAEATIATMKDMQRPLPDLEQVRNWIGAGVERLLHRALTGKMDGKASEHDLQRAGAYFIGHYNRSNGVYASLYPGVREALDFWQGREVPMVCATNKPERYTLPLIEQFGLEGYFQEIFSGDSLAHKKPHPEPLLKAAEVMGVPVADCLMIGDSAADIKAALAAGMPVAYVAYGYNQGRDLSALGESLKIESFTDLEFLWRQAPAGTVAAASHA